MLRGGTSGVHRCSQWGGEVSTINLIHRFSFPSPLFPPLIPPSIPSLPGLASGHAAWRYQVEALAFTGLASGHAAWRYQVGCMLWRARVFPMVGETLTINLIRRSSFPSPHCPPLFPSLPGLASGHAAWRYQVDALAGTGVPNGGGRQEGAEGRGEEKEEKGNDGGKERGEEEFGNGEGCWEESRDGKGGGKMEGEGGAERGVSEGCERERGMKESRGGEGRGEEERGVARGEEERGEEAKGEGERGEEEEGSSGRRSGREVCVFDNRGVGHSSCPTDPSEYTTEVMAADAYHGGGMIACKVAAAASHRIISLALISVSGGGFDLLPRVWLPPSHAPQTPTHPPTLTVWRTPPSSSHECSRKVAAVASHRIISLALIRVSGGGFDLLPQTAPLNQMLLSPVPLLFSASLLRFSSPLLFSPSLLPFSSPLLFSPSLPAITPARLASLPHGRLPDERSNRTPNLRAQSTQKSTQVLMRLKTVSCAPPPTLLFLPPSPQLDSRVFPIAYCLMNAETPELCRHLDSRVFSIAYRLLNARTPESRAQVDLDTHFSQEYMEETDAGTGMSRREALHMSNRSMCAPSAMQKPHGAANGHLNRDCMLDALFHSTAGPTPSHAPFLFPPPITFSSPEHVRERAEYVRELSVPSAPCRHHTGREYVRELSAPSAMQTPHGANGHLNACWTHSLTPHDVDEICSAHIPTAVIHGRYILSSLSFLVAF
ncbi:unnamed protein product [Closterium sp. NIES-64]|nr:unnamed protein product [Closterium sp. NIES-64]